MVKRNFSIPDSVVLKNLESLDGYASRNYQSDNEQFHALLVSIIGIHKLLPPMIGRMISIDHCIVGDTYWDRPQAVRDAKWAKIQADLNSGLDAVLDAQTQWDAATLSDRPTTQGERMLALTAQWRAGGERSTISKRLESASIGTDASFDAKNLVRLTEKKRITNLATHNAELGRLIHRIEAIAHRSHHRS